MTRLNFSIIIYTFFKKAIHDFFPKFILGLLIFFQLLFLGQGNLFFVRDFVLALVILIIRPARFELILHQKAITIT